MKQLLLLFCLFCLTNVQAQRTNFDKIVMPPEQMARDYKEALVQLAWVNNPDNKVLQHEVSIAEIEKKSLKWGWAENIQATFNLNEGHFKKNSPAVSDTTITDTTTLIRTIAGGSNLFFPRYNFSASISLGALFKNSREKKIARQKLDIAHHKVNQRKLQIRAETLTRYEDYLMTIEMLKLRTQAVEDFYATYLALSKKFKESRASLEEYNQASSTYYTALENKLRSESEVAVAKISLEEMIGVRLEEVRAK
ncbi:MAG: TolC family protein [Chitinophagales bacterium]